MHLNEIKAIARERGIKTRKMNKDDLLRAILGMERDNDRFEEVTRIPRNRTKRLLDEECQF
ncbi:MAG TPA: Rho termination factor N-terminal domain-containing protein [Geobacteraceae bacterium]|nr:Rho termination factor N-terminal domain-containing protein [Geobacteraceae bacterium]